MDENMCVFMICWTLWATSFQSVDLSNVTVRLVGPDPCEGRLEIYFENAWGTVCSGMWDLNDAGVVCGELGCGSALEASTTGKYGQGPPYGGLTYFQCTGTESSLLSVLYTYLPHSHLYQSDSGVKCSGRRRVWQLQLHIRSNVALENVGNATMEKAVISAISSLPGQTIINLTIRKKIKL
ncbi:scavenger receptor cysteine-rich domain-containing group B protein-like [Discoglossus pictus]